MKKVSDYLYISDDGLRAVEELLLGDYYACYVAKSSKDEMGLHAGLVFKTEYADRFLEGADLEDCNLTWVEGVSDPEYRIYASEVGRMKMVYPNEAEKQHANG